MANETANYKLITDVVNDDFVQPEHNNRAANTLDRTLGTFLRRIITAGVFEGWEVTSAKQVDAGEGLIAACWCSTVAEQDINDLTNGAVNYVFAEVTDTSGADGSVNFRAQTSGRPAPVLPHRVARALGWRYRGQRSGRGRGRLHCRARCPARARRNRLRHRRLRLYLGNR